MLRTPLYDIHLQLGAKMVEFAGWEMPLLYTGIVEEHHHTRRAASIFDVSHMGRIALEGPGAQTLLSGLLTTDVEGLKDGRAKYSLVCGEDGGILDDVVLLRRSEGRFLVVCNASNRLAMLDWLM